MASVRTRSARSTPRRRALHRCGHRPLRRHDSVAIPYGPTTGDLNVLEWTLSALALIAALGLLADMIPRLNPTAHTRGLAFMTAGFTWAVTGIYDLLVPGDHTLAWRLGHTFPDLGWGILALTAWRLVVVETRTPRRTP